MITDPATKEFRSNYDRIFGKPEDKVVDRWKPKRPAVLVEAVRQLFSDGITEGTSETPGAGTIEAAERFWQAWESLQKEEDARVEQLEEWLGTLIANLGCLLHDNRESLLMPTRWHLGSMLSGAVTMLGRAGRQIARPGSIVAQAILAYKEDEAVMKRLDAEERIP